MTVTRSILDLSFRWPTRCGRRASQPATARGGRSVAVWIRSVPGPSSSRWGSRWAVPRARSGLRCGRGGAEAVVGTVAERDVVVDLPRRRGGRRREGALVAVGRAEAPGPDL